MPSRKVFDAALALAFVCTLAACAANPEPNSIKAATVTRAAPSDVGVMPAELNIAHSGLYRAWQGDDAMAMRPYYTDDAVVVATSGRYTGWQDIHTRWLVPTLKDISDFMAMPSSFTRNGDEIVEVGRYMFTITRDGKTEQQRGTYSQRWRLQPNHMWRLTSVNIAKQ